MPYFLNPLSGTFDFYKNGTVGPAGPGVPVGGTANQVLAKIDSTNFNTQWVTPLGGGATNLSIVNRGASTLDVASDTGTDATIPAATTSLTGLLTGADKARLDGIATGATVNAPDSALRDRATHTGTQAGNTVTGAYTAAGLTMSTARLLGRSTAGTGAVEEITLGTNLSFTGTTLNALGGGSPGGSNTQVQFNNAGALAGAARVEIKSGDLQLEAPSTAPGAADASSLLVYPVSLADRFMMAMQGPTGSAVLLQPSLFSTNVMTFFPQTGTGGTGGSNFQSAWTSNGTVTTPSPAATSLATAVRRTNYTNVVTTTNQQLGPRMNTGAERAFFRGNVAGTGGFFYFSRFRVVFPAATCRLFSGLQGNGDTSSVCTSDAPGGPYCGLRHITTDPATGSGALNFVTHDGSARTDVAINLASNIVTDTLLFDFMMYNAPNGATIFFRLDDLTNNVTYTGSSATNLPAATAMLSPQCQASNGTANITASTVSLALSRIYVESAF